VCSVSDAHKDFEELRSQVAITLEEENALRAEVVKVKRESEQWTVAVNNEERMVAGLRIQFDATSYLFVQCAHVFSIQLRKEERKYCSRQLLGTDEK